MTDLLTTAQIAGFHRDGYLICRDICTDRKVDKLLSVAKHHLTHHTPPLEYEADVQYPGAPSSKHAQGGETIRRLLGAYQRDPIYRNYVHSDIIASRVRQLLCCHSVMLSQNHHNCIMTKHPSYSSRTDWHQDNRYWQFQQANLVTAWTALQHETINNGCLYVIPSSHNYQVKSRQLDDNLFLRQDEPCNKQWLANAIAIELARGDVLFFHSKLFHAAGQNHTNMTKYSLVFTFHQCRNNPLPGTRSDKLPGIQL